MSRIDKNGLKISSTLFEFINNEVTPNTNINIEEFWSKFADAVHQLSPLNKDLIKKREEIQKKIDNWHKINKEKDFNKVEYINFLKSIGYLIEEKENFNIETSNVDEEISSIAGPQLVVPVDNSRYALNAANARWGSLYDALYGTDVIAGNIGKDWNKDRAIKVINYVRDFFDERFPLLKSSWKEVSKITIEENKLVFLSKSGKDLLKDNNQFIGFNGDKENPDSILLKKMQSNKEVGRYINSINHERFVDVIRLDT